MDADAGDVAVVRCTGIVVVAIHIRRAANAFRNECEHADVGYACVGGTGVLIVTLVVGYTGKAAIVILVAMGVVDARRLARNAFAALAGFPAVAEQIVIARCVVVDRRSFALTGVRVTGPGVAGVVRRTIDDGCQALAVGTSVNGTQRSVHFAGVGIVRREDTAGFGITDIVGAELLIVARRIVRLTHTNAVVIARIDRAVDVVAATACAPSDGCVLAEAIGIASVKGAVVLIIRT